MRGLKNMMGAWPTLVLDTSKTEWWESRVGRPFWFEDNLYALKIRKMQSNTHTPLLPGP